MSQKKNEGILFPTEIRVVGSYTDRLLKIKLGCSGPLQSRGLQFTVASLTLLIVYFSCCQLVIKALSMVKRR